MGYASKSGDPPNLDVWPRASERAGKDRRQRRDEHPAHDEERLEHLAVHGVEAVIHPGEPGLHVRAQPLHLRAKFDAKQLDALTEPVHSPVEAVNHVVKAPVGPRAPLHPGYGARARRANDTPDVTTSPSSL